MMSNIIAEDECEVRMLKDNLSLDSAAKKVDESIDRYIQNKLEKFGTSPRLYGVLYEAVEDEYGNEVLKKVNANCVVAGGAIFALMKIFDVEANWFPASLNQIYGINNDIEGDINNSHVALFGVGIGGCGLMFNSIIDPDPKQRDVADLIPIRVSTDELLTGTDAEKYFFKTTMPGDGTTYAWMLKEFDQPIKIRSFWKDAAEEGVDGTEITGDIHESSRTEGQEHFAEMVLKFNKDDVRSYWESIGSMDMARFNAIGIYFGEKVIVDPTTGREDYINVRLFSTVNFENDSVKDRKEIKYVYRIYAMI